MALIPADELRSLEETVHLLRSRKNTGWFTWSGTNRSTFSNAGITTR